MIKHLYGEDTYSVAAVAKKIAADFVDREKSDLNLNTIDSSALTLENFSGAVLSLPFLGDKKLTIVKNLLIGKEYSDLRKKIIPIIEKMPKSSEVIFADEGKPDARDTLYKYLQKNAKCKYYGPATEAVMRHFATSKLESEKIKINNAAMAKLTLFVGTDLWRLRNELLKLISFVRAQNRDEITVDDVMAMVSPSVDLKIFDLTDALAAKNAKRAISLLGSFIANNEDLMMVFNMVIYQLRNMIIIKDLIDKKENNIAKTAGLHPFVVQKTTLSVNKISADELAHFYRQIENVDYQIKTGKTDVENALVLLFVNFCRSDKILL